MSLLQALQLPAPKHFLPMASGPATTVPGTVRPAAAPPGKPPAGGDANADLRAKALRLHAAIEAKRKQQADLLKQLQDAEPKLEKLAKAALTDDAKKLVADKQALVAKKKKEVERDLADIEADLDTIDNGGARPDALVKVLAKHGSGGKVAATRETFDFSKDSLKANPLKQEVTTTTASADRNVSTIEKKRDSSTLDLKGLTRTESKEKEVSSANLTARTSEEKKTNASLTGKYSKDESKKTEIELPDGRTSSLETGKSTELSAKGGSRTDTVKKTNFDGSGTEVTRKKGIERGEGKLNATQETSVTRTDAKGTDRTTEKKLTGGMIAGKDGIGAGGEAEGGKKITSKGGAQAAAKLNLHASVTCSIGDPKGDPPKYPVTLTVNIGGSASVSGGAGQKKDAKRSGKVELKGSEDRTMVVTHMLGEEQLGLYTKALEQASKGSKVAATEKEFAIIAAVAKGNSDEAYALWKTGGKIDKKATDGLVNAGDSIKVSETTGKGIGVTGEGHGVGLGAGVNVTDSKSLEVKRNEDGGIDAETENEHGTEKNLSGSMAPGVMGLKVGYKKAHKTSFGYSITIDRKNDPDGKVLEALGRCSSEKDYDAFLAAYKGRYKLTGKTKGVSDAESLDTGLSIAGVDVAGMSEGHGVDEKTKTDADGKLVEKTVAGHGSIGGKLGGWADSKNDDAVAHIKGDGTASLDLTTTTHDNHNQRAKDKKLKNLTDKLTGKAPADGALTTAAGGGAEPDTATHDVCGLKLANKDLKRLGKSCCNSPAAFIGWRRRADEKDDITKAAAAIVKGKGSAPAVAEALARFIGGDSVERLETVRQMMRGGYKQTAGAAFEFPDDIRGLQEDYDTVTDTGLVAAINKIGAKSQEKAKDECLRLVKVADSLMSGISACRDFKNPDIRAEMLLKLELTRQNLSKAAKGFAHIVTAEDKKELEETGNRLVGQCTHFWGDMRGLVGELNELKGDYPRFRAGDVGDARKLIKKLETLLDRWRGTWYLLKDNYKARGIPEAAAKTPTLMPDETIVDAWDKACGG